MYNYVKGKEKVGFSKSKRKDKEDLRGRVLFRKPCRNRDETSLVEKDGGKRFPKGDSFSGWRERERELLFSLLGISRDSTPRKQREYLSR